MHPNDDKFKEMLEQKEKEQKKVAKEAKKKARQDQLMAKLLGKGVENEKPTGNAKGGVPVPKEAREDDVKEQ